MTIAHTFIYLAALTGAFAMALLLWTLNTDSRLHRRAAEMLVAQAFMATAALVAIAAFFTIAGV